MIFQGISGPSIDRYASIPTVDQQKDFLCFETIYKACLHQKLMVFGTLSSPHDAYPYINFARCYFEIRITLTIY